MYNIQLDAETSLADISALPGIQVVATLYGVSYATCIKFHDSYILLNDEGEVSFGNYSNKLDVNGYISGDLTSLSMYVNDCEYEVGKEFQDFLFANGIRSTMMHI